MVNIENIFKEYEGSEFLKFEKVENKLSNRRDLHALILMDKLVPSHVDMISGAEHDQIWFDCDVEDLEKAATFDDVINLIRCGIFLCSETGSLSMFV